MEVTEDEKALLEELRAIKRASAGATAEDAGEYITVSGVAATPVETADEPRAKSAAASKRVADIDTDAY